MPTHNKPLKTDLFMTSAIDYWRHCLNFTGYTDRTNFRPIVATYACFLLIFRIAFTFDSLRIFGWPFAAAFLLFLEVPGIFYGYLLFLLPILSLVYRRLHDVGLSLISITLIHIPWLLLLYWRSSQIIDNTPLLVWSLLYLILTDLKKDTLAIKEPSAQPNWFFRHATPTETIEADTQDMTTHTTHLPLKKLFTSSFALLGIYLSAGILGTLNLFLIR